MKSGISSGCRGRQLVEGFEFSLETFKTVVINYRGKVDRLHLPGLAS